MNVSYFKHNKIIKFINTYEILGTSSKLLKKIIFRIIVGWLSYMIFYIEFTIEIHYHNHWCNLPLESEIMFEMSIRIL